MLKAEGDWQGGGQAEHARLSLRLPGHWCAPPAASRRVRQVYGHASTQWVGQGVRHAVGKGEDSKFASLQLARRRAGAKACSMHSLNAVGMLQVSLRRHAAAALVPGSGHQAQVTVRWGLHLHHTCPRMRMSTSSSTPA